MDSPIAVDRQEPPAGAATMESAVDGIAAGIVSGRPEVVAAAARDFERAMEEYASRLRGGASPSPPRALHRKEAVKRLSCWRAARTLAAWYGHAAARAAETGPAVPEATP
jgi:hypothetical protein